MIEFKNISMAYPNATEYALKNISFNINNGEFVFLIGHSGSGKSTIIKLISCEERPNAGSLSIDNINIHNLRKKMIPYLRRSIGMVFQDFRLIPSKTVYENVAFAMQILGHSRKQIRRRVSIVLSIVGLKDKEKMKPSELSGGEQQRVAIARAIVNNPMLLVADEPTGNLDPANSESIMAILDEINRNGTTVIICTHDYNLVNRMKKRVIEIERGRIIRDEAGASYQKDFTVEQANLDLDTDSESYIFENSTENTDGSPVIAENADSNSEITNTGIRSLDKIVSNLDLVFHNDKKISKNLSTFPGNNTNTTTLSVQELELNSQLSEGSEPEEIAIREKESEYEKISQVGEKQDEN